jgi:hypothetical protein
MLNLFTILILAVLTVIPCVCLCAGFLCASCEQPIPKRINLRPLAMLEVAGAILLALIFWLIAAWILAGE